MAEEIITNFPELLDVPIEGDPSFQPTGTTGFAKEFRGDVYSSRGRFGNGSAYIDISATEIKSNNFVSGSLGWRIKYNGDVEFSSGTFRANVTGATITGGLIQSSTSGQRVVIQSDELNFYDSSDTLRMALNSDTDGITLYDELGVRQGGISGDNQWGNYSVLMLHYTGVGNQISMYFSDIANVSAKDFIPDTNNTFDLGSSTYKWKDLYISGSIIGGSGISLEAGEDLVLGDAVYISTGGLAATKTIENVEDGSDAVIYGTRWGGQTFSFDEEFTITTIGLEMRKIGTPTGNLVLEVFATDGNGAPTGAALGSKTVAATANVSYATKTFTLDTPTPLDANTTYIFTIKAVDTSEVNRLEWQYDDGGNPYAGGSMNYSIDSGVNWVLNTSNDFAFEINSHPRAGRLYKTDASFADERITGFIGIAGESITAGVNGSIVAAGVVAGASGLTVGAKVYLSDTTGAVSSSAGSNSKTVGLAYSATEVIINYSI